MRANFDEQNERLVKAIEGIYSRLADVATTLEESREVMDMLLARLDKPIAMMQVPVPDESYLYRADRPVGTIDGDMWWDGSEWRNVSDAPPAKAPEYPQDNCSCRMCTDARKEG